jgi:hypothetical protein
LQEAYRRVVRNKGAPGVDGMTVDALGEYPKTKWTHIRKESVDITKPVRFLSLSRPPFQPVAEDSSACPAGFFKLSRPTLQADKSSCTY